MYRLVMVFAFLFCAGVLVTTDSQAQGCCQGALSICYGFTEVDPLHTYTTDNPHMFPNGFVGTRNPAAAHTGLAFSEMTGQYLRYDGGSSDDLRILIPVAFSPASWRLTVHFQYKPGGCSSRELFLIEDVDLAGNYVGGFSGVVSLSGVSLNGVLGAFPSSPDTWYTMQIDNDANANTCEIRVWADGNPPAASAIVTTAAMPAISQIRLRAGNFCAPEKWVDCLTVQDLGTVPTNESTWGQIKTLYH